jgi:tetratricopeptide (TPR) repeat protein
MTPQRVFASVLPLATLLLAACTSNERGQTTYRGTPPPEVTPPPVVESAPPQRIIRARILADILYEAQVAFEDNRLMSPAGNNAYDRYREVLDIDPDNAVARQGVIDIVLRYIQLADVAMGQGQYDNAASLLARGASILPERPELDAAHARLAAARENQVETFALDPEGLRAQSLEMMSTLSEIAQHIRTREAVFLINARTDDEGRWIYKVMREAVGGYRLRGNIDIAGTPNIVVTVPRD